MASHSEQLIPLTTSEPTVKACQLADDIGVGDCEQLAGSSVIALRLPQPFDFLATVIWGATVKTNHPQPGFHDTWHQTFDFRTADGQTVGTFHTDGPDMSDTNNHSVQTSGTMSINTNIWDQMTTVRWSYEC
jgi:hypothetical protein